MRARFAGREPSKEEDVARAWTGLGPGPGPECTAALAADEPAGAGASLQTDLGGRPRKKRDIIPFEAGVL